MEKTMGNIEVRIQRCEEDIKELKRYKDECSKDNNKTKNDLTRTIQKIEDLIKSVDKLPESLEKSMLKSIELQSKENEKKYGVLEDRVVELQKDNVQTKEDLANLKQLIDDRTVNEDSDNYRQIKITIVTTIITAILSFILGLILK